MAVTYSASSVTAKDGAPSADFVVKRTGTTAELNIATSVGYSTQDITAKAGTDYVETSGSLAFAPGASEQTLEVSIIDAAYESKATLTFLLNLVGFGAATGSISPSPSEKNKQSYLYIPADDTMTHVPTADSPGDNLPHQARYKDFADPTEGNTQLDRPLAYLRMGYARADLNYYERIILNTDTYHPKWRDGDADPVEAGAMDKFMLPRAINRVEDPGREAEKNNEHLDGMLIYSDKNYSLTVGEQASMVVQGDFIQDVEGTGRLNWKDKKAEWIYDGGEDSFRVASGVTKINGQPAEYKISSARSLSVNAEQQVSYAFGAKYSVSTDAEMSISNAAQYEVANSIKLEVKGLQVAAECDIMGNFEVKYPTGEVMTTRNEVGLAASHEINMSIQAGTSAAWTAAVATAAAANSAAALLISTGVAAATFKSDSDFYKTASPGGLETSYNDAVADALPDTCAALAAVTAGILVGASIAQAIAEELPTPMPKIEMTPEGMTLSVGPDTTLELTVDGITVIAPDVNFLTMGSFGVVSGGAVDIGSVGDISLEAVGINITGLTTMEDLIAGDVVAEDILANAIVTA